MPNIDNIVKQLKNRKVFRSLAIYAGFAFVLIQVCSIVFPALYLPDWTMTLLVVLLIIGFPTTLVLSWIYDITPTDDGEAPSKEAKQPLGVYALTGLVLTVIGVGFWVSISVFGLSFGGDDEVPSIAIIPFDNKGDKEEDFYAYSISSELISDVAGAGLIRVASLKRVEELGDINIEEKAQKLDVRYITTGSIWKIDSVFQLSMELYDTKTSKVLWSESWQRAWNELASIKGSLAENILTTLKISTKQDIVKAPTSNTEAYKYYLEGKYKYEKRENMKDTEIARGLLRKAIELDDNLLIAKNVLAVTYFITGDYDKSMEIYLENLKKAEEIGDKDIQGKSLNNIGIVHADKGDYDKALDYYKRSLAIAEELGDKRGMGYSLGNIGAVHSDKGDLDTALDYYKRSLAIHEEFGNKRGVGYSLYNIGGVHYNKGDYDKALDYYKRSLAIHEELGDKREMGNSINNIGNVHADKDDLDTALDYYERSLVIREELGDKRGVGYSLNNIGIVHHYKGDYEKAEDYLEMALANDKEIGLGVDDLIWSTTYLYLTYKHLGKEYDENEIHTLIKDAENIEFEINLRLYQLLEDKSYLETAYKQVQEKADNLEPDVAAKSLELPIPKAIVEEWEKVK